MAAFDAIFASGTKKESKGDLFAANSKFRSTPGLVSAAEASAIAPPSVVAAAPVTNQSGVEKLDASQPARTSQRVKSKRKAEAPASAPAISSAATSKRVKKSAPASEVKGPAATSAPQTAKQPQHHTAAPSASAKGESKGKGKGKSKGAPEASTATPPAPVKGASEAQSEGKEKLSKAAKKAAKKAAEKAPEGTVTSDSSAPKTAASAPSKAKKAGKTAKASKDAVTPVVKKVKAAEKSKAAKASGEAAEVDTQDAVPAHIEAAKGVVAAEVPPLAPLRKKLTREEEEEQLQRTIFVGNLPATLKGKAVKRLFLEYGKVASVRLRSVPVDLAKKMPRKAAVLSGAIAADRGTSHAYVVFSDVAAASAALALNMTVVGDLHIRVDRATCKRADGGGSVTADGPEGVEYVRARSIFVGNLHFDVQDEELIRIFSDAAVDPELAGAVTAVRVVRDRATNVGKGVAFVEFNSKDATRAALGLNGRVVHDRPMRVTRVKPPPPAGKAKAFAKPAVTNRQGAERRTHDPEQSFAQRSGGEKAGKDKETPSWMGLQTKGPSKGVRGSGAVVISRPKRGAPAVTPYTSSAKEGPGKVKNSKRPAVAARKQAKGPAGVKGGVTKARR